MIKTNSYTPFVNDIWSVHAILQKKKNIRKFCKYCNLKTNSTPFSVYKELQTISLGNEIFEANDLYFICNNKAIKICSNQQADLIRFLYKEDSLKIKRTWN